MNFDTTRHNQATQLFVARPRLARLCISLLISAQLATTGCTSSPTDALAVAVASTPASEIPLNAPNAPNAEEGRVDQALIALGDSASAVTQKLIFAPLAETAPRRRVSNAQRKRLLNQAQQAGESLWRDATRSASTAALDDRPLYWRRLLEKREFRKQCVPAVLCDQALHVFERASRGATDLKFTTEADLRILLSGFDPFGLDKHIDQSNPSGAAAIALDNQSISANGKTAEVQTVLFPVRFADFDEGMVEEIFEPFVSNPADDQTPDMLITISMGRSDFDLERFPGRRRSATAPDNLRVKTGANPTSPLLPMLAGEPLSGPEFVEFSLPVAQLRAIQAPYRVNDNRNVETLKNGRFLAESLTQLEGQTAVSGSGGGYLSNEISYRTVRLVRVHGKNIAVGHIHTPRIEAFDQTSIHAISAQIHAMLREAIGARLIE